MGVVCPIAKNSRKMTSIELKMRKEPENKAYKTNKLIIFTNRKKQKRTINY